MKTIKSSRWVTVGLVALVGVGGVVAASAATAEPAPVVVVVVASSDPQRDSVLVERQTQRVADAEAARTAAAVVEAARVAAVAQATADAQAEADAQEKARTAADARAPQASNNLPVSKDAMVSKAQIDAESIPDPGIVFDSRILVPWISDLNPDNPSAGHWKLDVCAGGTTTESDGSIFCN